MSIQPIPHEQGRFFVQSQSRPWLQHTVDLQGQETNKDKPCPWCGCEDYQYRGHYCRHIAAVVQYEKLRLSL